MKRRNLLAASLAIPFGALAVRPAAGAEIRMGVVLKTLSSQYWKIVAAGARTAAKEHGVSLILLGPPTEDAVEQEINMVEDVLAQNPAALIFAPSQPPTAANVLLKAKAKHVPVLLVDTGMPASFTDYASFIGTDNVVAGKAGGTALAQALKKGSKVLLLNGAPGNPSTGERIDGAEQALKEAGMVVAAKQPAYSDREKGYTVTQNVLQSHPDVEGVFAANDEMALGALRAMQQAGKKVPIIGVDAVDDALKAIVAGDMYGSVAQGNYEMGRLGVERALDVIAGKSIPKRIDSGATMITKANAQKLLDFHASIR